VSFAFGSCILNISFRQAVDLLFQLVYQLIVYLNGRKKKVPMRRYFPAHSGTCGRLFTMTLIADWRLKPVGTRFSDRVFVRAGMMAVVCISTGILFTETISIAVVSM
jgi:hypothetical protein